MKKTTGVFRRAPLYLMASLLLAPNAWSSKASVSAAAIEAATDTGEVATTPFSRTNFIVAPDDFKTKHPIIETLREGGDPFKAMKSLIQAYAPHSNAGGLFFDAFMSKYGKETELANPLLPITTVLHYICLPHKEQVARILNVGQIEDLEVFKRPGVFDEQQALDNAPYYQALRLAGLFGSKNALQLLLDFKALSGKPKRDDILVFFNTISLNPTGNATDNFVLWAEVLKAVIVGAHTPAGDENKSLDHALSRHLGFGDTVRMHGWNAQLDGRFSALKGKLTPKEAHTILKAATKLGKALIPFIGKVMEAYSDKNLQRWSWFNPINFAPADDVAEKRLEHYTELRKVIPDLADIGFGVHNSVNAFLTQCGIIDPKTSVMNIPGVIADSQEEYNLFMARYEMYQTFVDSCFLDPLYENALSNVSRPKQEMPLLSLLENIKHSGMQCAGHACLQTDPKKPFDTEMQAHYEGKLAFLPGFLNAVGVEEVWLNKKISYCIDFLQRSKQNLLFSTTTENAAEKQVVAFRSIVFAQEAELKTAKEAFEVFQETERAPALQAIEDTRVLIKVEEALTPEASNEQTAPEFIASMQTYFQENDGKLDQLTYLNKMYEEAKDSTLTAQEYMKGRLQIKRALLSQQLKADEALIKRNAELGAVIDIQAIVLAYSKKTLAVIFTQSEKSRQEVLKLTGLIEAYTGHQKILEKPTPVFAAIAAAQKRVQGEYEALSAAKTASDAKKAAAADQ